MLKVTPNQPKPSCFILIFIKYTLYYLLSYLVLALLFCLFSDLQSLNMYYLD